MSIAAARALEFGVITLLFGVEHDAAVISENGRLDVNLVGRRGHVIIDLDEDRELIVRREFSRGRRRPRQHALQLLVWPAVGTRRPEAALSTSPLMVRGPFVNSGTSRS